MGWKAGVCEGWRSTEPGQERRPVFSCVYMVFDVSLFFEHAGNGDMIIRV